MSEPLHIACDLDDVVLDFMPGVLDALHREYGVRVPLEDVQGWHVAEVLDPIIGYSWWKWLRRRDWLWATFLAVPGAIGSLERLRDEGHYLELLTSKPRWAEHNVWKWLGKWRPPFNQVTITDPDESKADMSDADVLIDDKPANIEAWVTDGRLGVLFSRPWNASDLQVPSDLYIRVSDWQGVLETLGMEAAAA